jgi:hypothetical protein
MSALVSNSHGSKFEISRRHPSSGRELTWRHAVILAVAGGATVRSLHSPFQSTEDPHDSGLTS